MFVCHKVVSFLSVGKYFANHWTDMVLLYIDHFMCLGVVLGFLKKNNMVLGYFDAPPYPFEYRAHRCLGAAAIYNTK